MTATLEPHGNQWQLRFRRALPHPREKVWRAITETEHLRVWFPDRIEGDFAVGAHLRFVSEHAPPFEGEVLAYEPPSLLEFTWGTDMLRFELASDGENTVLTLLDTFAEQGKAARDGAGWHTCLDALEYDLAGGTPPWTTTEHWKDVHADYVAQLGPAAATIGPPEGY